MNAAPNQNSRPKVAVIGAGWAGLAAAVHLVQGAEVTLFEAGRHGGGRARAFGGSADFAHIDNGQHILIGAYTAVLRLLETVGVKADEVLWRRRHFWYLADGVRWHSPLLPAPLHIAAALVGARGFRLPEKLACLKSAAALKRVAAAPHSPDTDVAAWLAQQQVPRKVVDEFWRPLVLSALNTPLQRASLATLAAVVAQGLLQSRAASDYLLPKVDFGQLLVEPACAYLRRHGARLCFATRVGGVLPQAGGVMVDGERFDYALIATAPYHAAALVPEPWRAEVAPLLAALDYAPITSVYLRYREAFRLPEVLTGFAYAPVHWLVDRHALGLGCNEVSAVISCAPPRPTREWIEATHTVVQSLCPHLGEPMAAQVITEKRATFHAAPNLRRLEAGTLKEERIWFAGDYCHAFFPATLEGAVQSGQAAAQAILDDFRTADES